jgi:hypothetical protein
MSHLGISTPLFGINQPLHEAQHPSAALRALNLINRNRWHYPSLTDREIAAGHEFYYFDCDGDYAQKLTVPYRFMTDKPASTGRVTRANSARVRVQSNMTILHR